jgi:dihydrodipicolinate synthase/N-acetylneuraminate lyase
MALTNIAPEQCFGIYRYAQQGRQEEARRLQLRMISPNIAVAARFGVLA